MQTPVAVARRPRVDAEAVPGERSGGEERYDSPSSRSS